MIHDHPEPKVDLCRVGTREMMAAFVAGKRAKVRQPIREVRSRSGTGQTSRSEDFRRPAFPPDRFSSAHRPELPGALGPYGS